MTRPASYLDIDPHGRVVPNGDPARRALADRAGRFLVLPSAPDLLVARRVPPAGGASAPPHCILAGDLSTLPVAELVGFVGQARLSGLLSVSTPGVERALAFRDGEVRGAQSEAPGERIGEVALRLGYVTAEELARATGTGRPLGKVLVERGHLQPPDLWKCLHEQVSAVFHAILLAQEGVFALVDEPELELGIALSVNTQSLLMNGIRRIDEGHLFRARIPGPHAYPRRRIPKVPITLHPSEARILELVDGRRTVADVAREAHLGEFDATKILYHLAEAGYVEATGGQMAPRGSSDERLAALTRGMNEILLDVTRAAATRGGIDTFLAGIRTFLSDATSRFAPLWRGAALQRDGTIDPAALSTALAGLQPGALARLEPSGDAARLAFDALRELMFFYLFQAGERLPPADDERLGAEVKRRFEALGELR